MVLSPIIAPRSKVTELTDDTKYDSLNLEQKKKSWPMERHRSAEVSQAILSKIEHDGFQLCHQPQILEIIKGGCTPRSSCDPSGEFTADSNGMHRHTITDAAWEALKQSIVYFKGQPIGTLAAIDKSQAELNYDQVTFSFPVEPLFLSSL